MGRRQFAIFVALAAAAGGIALAVVLLFGADGRAGAPAQSDANGATDGSAGPRLHPASDVKTAEGAKANAASNSLSDESARRELEGCEEVEFPGLIELAQRQNEVVPVEGTLVLKNADPAAPPLRLEIPFHQSHFRGRGPGNASVVVERLVVSGREAAAREEVYKLANKWIQIHATLATPFLLHVVDAASGRELSGVTLRDGVHDENKATPGGGARSGWFSLVRARRSTAPAGGFDSPLELAEFGWSSDQGGMPWSDEIARYVFVHAPGYGDDAFEVDAEEPDGTLALRAAASLRARVTPWPPPKTDAAPGANDQVTKRFVTIARRVDPPRSEGGEAVTTADEIPRGLAPRTAALAREAIARRDRRLLAAQSPQSHVAIVDADGGATFDDLCEGEWLAWSGGRDLSPLAIVNANGRRFGVRGVTTYASIDPLEFTARAGRHEEITLRTDVEVAEAVATLVVRAVDETSGDAVALQRDEIEADALDDPETAMRTAAADVKFRGRDFGRFAIAASTGSTGGKDVALSLHPGATVIHVVPRAHPDFDPAEQIVELTEGANEVVVALPRAQGVIVSIDADKAFADGGVNWIDATALKLIGNGVEYEPTTWWSHGRNQPSRRMHRFGPLPSGRYTLIVPQDAGFDRAGEIPVDVRPHEITTIELGLKSSGAPRKSER